MTKIQWEGWGQFDDIFDFLEFVKSDVNGQLYHVLWPTTDCPIVIWLN